MARDYSIITREELNRMLDTRGKTYEPRGLFLTQEDVDGVEVWTAVNNINGDALTEEFIARQAAVRWLHGYTALERTKYKQKVVNASAERLEKIVRGE